MIAEVFDNGAESAAQWFEQQLKARNVPVVFVDKLVDDFKYLRQTVIKQREVTVNKQQKILVKHFGKESVYR